MRRNGFTLTELLVALVVTGVVISGVIGLFVMQKRVAKQEQIESSMDDSLRIGLMRISDSLRDVGYGTPETDLALWIPWVSGFSSNPRVQDGVSGAPDAIDIALCRSGASSVLSANAALDGTTLSLQDSALVDTARRRLISIGGLESAHVVSTAGATINIDTDPGATAAQGLIRTHFAGTPVCRVDVASFAIDSSNNRLTIDNNDGNGPVALLDQISDMQVEAVMAGKQYRITLTAVSRDPDPGTGAVITRNASTLVTVRN